MTYSKSNIIKKIEEFGKLTKEIDMEEKGKLSKITNSLFGTKIKSIVEKGRILKEFGSLFFASKEKMINKIRKDFNEVMKVATEIETHKESIIKERKEVKENLLKVLDDKEIKEKLEKIIKIVTQDIDWISPQVDGLKNCMKLLEQYSKNEERDWKIKYEGTEPTLGIIQRMNLINNFEERKNKVISIINELYLSELVIERLKRKIMEDIKKEMIELLVQSNGNKKQIK